jgi:enoyl-[acyl-carrier protein] reductase II
MINPVCSLFNIRYPIVQAGMIWCSGWRLAAAVSNAGALGLIGSGSMYPDVLREHIQKCKAATTNAYGVNVPLLYPDIEKIMDIIVEENVKIVFTSAGNPATWTRFLKDKGITVVHVISNSRFAKKAEDCGADAVVAEGFEAGGHNGREETTTMCLVPVIRNTVKIPVIAAGGIASGRSMMAAFALGASGVQVGSRFVLSEESSAHENFKNRVLAMQEGDTILTLKKLTPVRMIKNDFYEKVAAAESKGATIEELKSLLGRARAKRGMHEGDLAEGELEIGQVASSVKQIRPAAEIVAEIWEEFREMKNEIALL